MAERKNLTEGQEVRVFGTRRNPSEAVAGHIAKVGRTIVDITCGGYKPYRFYIESQKQIGESYGYGVSFKTLDQVALIQRESRAVETLRQHGLGRLGWGHTKASLDVLEAAAEAVLAATEDL